MRNIIWDIEFVFDVIRKGGPYALLGGVVAIVGGLLLSKPLMLLVGGVLIIAVGLDYVIALFQKR